MKFLLIYLIWFTSLGCSNAQTVAVPCEQKLTSLSWDSINEAPAKDSLPKVYIFLSTECPLCRNVIATCNNLQQRYKCQWIGIIADKKTSNKSLKEFTKTYKPEFPLLIDKHAKWVTFFKATITPEVFIIKNSKVVYAGALDNRLSQPGQYRKVINEKYVEDVLQKLDHHLDFEPFCTTAIGCYIFP